MMYVLFVLFVYLSYIMKITKRKLDRFEEAFGKVDLNFVIENHTIVVANSMNLEQSSYEVLCSK